MGYQALVREPKSKDKSLLPDVNRNGDVPTGETAPLPALMVNGAAIANGKPDVVATEIAIGIRHLSCKQLAWVIQSAAANGLSDDCLKAVIKSAKQALNSRHHPEYFTNGHSEIDSDADDEELSLGVPDENDLEEDF